VHHSNKYSNSICYKSLAIENYEIAVKIIAVAKLGEKSKV
jgi:hypothetical protein